MPGDEEPAPKKPRKRRRWKRWTLLILLVLLVASLFVLNGPGWRWIAQRVAARYLPDLGLSGTVEFGGTLSKGKIYLEGVDLHGDGAIRSVKLDQITLRYQPLKVIHGEIEALAVKGLHVELDQDRPWPASKTPKDKKPTDLSTLSGTLHDLRERILPVEADVSDLRVTVMKGPQPVFGLASMDLSHKSGADRFELKLGELKFGTDRTLPPQQTALVWSKESIELEKALLMPGLSVESLKAALPADGALTYEGAILLQEARLLASGSLDEAHVRLADGSLVARPVAAMFGARIPADGTLESLEVDAKGLQGGLKTLDGTVRAGLRGISYEEWQVPALRLNGELKGTTITVDVSAEALGSPLTIAAKSTVSRDANGLRFQQATADVSLPDAATVMMELRPKLMKNLKDPAPVPASSLQVNAVAAFKDGAVSKADAHVVLTPVRPEMVSKLEVTAGWTPQGPIEAQVIADGAKVNATADLTAKHYQGRAAFEDFTPDRLRGWLAAFAVEVPPEMTLRGSWEGEGPFEANGHKGHAVVSNFVSAKTGGGPLTAAADVRYDWPKSAEVRGLNVVQGPEKIVCNAKLADQVLTLEELQWTDGTDILLDGKASVPVTENPADWKGLLKQTRPLAVDIESRELALSKLHPFLPPTTRFPEAARGKVALHLSGTPAEPKIDATLMARDLGVVDQPKVPKADLDLTMKTEGGELTVEGTLVTPGYPAANLSAKLPFRPGVWVDTPEILKSEKLDVAARIPNLDLSRFTAMAPGVKSLAGSLKADLTVGGTIGKPEPQGVIELKNGAVTLKTEDVPPLQAIGLKATATPAGVVIDRLGLQMDGGTFDGHGKLALAEGKPADIDLSLRGQALPLKRDDSMIIRANADLAVRGRWENATLSGSVSVVDSLFYRDIELLPIGVPFNQPSAPSLPPIDTAKKDAAAGAIPEPFRNWALSVKVKTANAFLVRGNLANGQATLDVDVTGTLGKPAPRGKALLHEVTAKLPFSTLIVDEGTVDFRPEAPFDPTLNIRGRSTIRPYEVNVYVYGAVSDPKVLTTSNPPLPETEVMTLLATGTTTAGIADPQAASSRGAQLLLEELRRGRIRYARRLQPLLKILDRVDFQIGEEDRYSGQKMNSATINLDDNWLITAGMGEQGNTRVTLMYLLRLK